MIFKQREGVGKKRRNAGGAVAGRKWYVNEMLKWYAEYSGTEGNPRKEVTCFVNHKASIAQPPSLSI